MIDTSTAMRWMTNNFLETGYTSFQASSVAAGYSLLDAIDGSQRTKVFKFGGRFLIEAGVNDKIYWDGGTYTIPAGDYNDADALATAIQALGVPMIYGAAENGYKFLFQDPLTYTVETSNNTTAAWETLGFNTGVDQTPTLNAGQYELTADRSRIHWPYEQINIDFGFQAQVGFVAMISDLTNDMSIPEGAVIRLKGNNVNNFTSPPLDQTLTWYKTGVFKFIDDIDDSVWQYIQIEIECPEGPFTPEIGYLYVGEYEALPDSRNISTGFDQVDIDPSDISSSDDGQLYSNTRTTYREFSSLAIGLSRPEQITFLKEIYARKQKNIPFFVALDPTEYLSSNFDEYLAYMRFDQEPRHKHILRDIFESSFSLVEVL